MSANNTPVKQLIDEAARLVVDKTMIRWDKAFWADAFNSAIRAILSIRPDALTANEDFVCVEGSTQTIPSNARFVVDVVRNKGGAAISGNVNLKMLDDYRPEWRTEPLAQAAKAWLYDDRNPNTFYMYPPVEAGTTIECVFAKVPTPVTTADYDSDTKCELNPVYDNAIIEWLVYRAFSEDAEFTANAARASTALNAFRIMLGDKSQADTIVQQKAQISKPTTLINWSKEQ